MKYINTYIYIYCSYPCAHIQIKHTYIIHLCAKTKNGDIPYMYNHIYIYNFVYMSIHIRQDPTVCPELEMVLLMTMMMMTMKIAVCLIVPCGGNV